MKPTHKNDFRPDIIKGSRLPPNENRKRRFKLGTLIVFNVLLTAAIWVFCERQTPFKANLQLNDFTWSNHSPDNNFNISYVSVHGTIYNLGPGIANNVNVIIDVYVDYQCGHHMDALIKKEILPIGSVEENCSKEFQYEIPYSANSTLPYFFKSVKHDLLWTS